MSKITSFTRAMMFFIFNTNTLKILAKALHTKSGHMFCHESVIG